MLQPPIPKSKMLELSPENAGMIDSFVPPSYNNWTGIVAIEGNDGLFIPSEKREQYEKENELRPVKRIILEFEKVLIDKIPFQAKLVSIKGEKLTAVHKLLQNMKNAESWIATLYDHRYVRADAVDTNYLAGNLHPPDNELKLLRIKCSSDVPQGPKSKRKKTAVITVYKDGAEKNVQANVSIILSRLVLNIDGLRRKDLNYENFETLFLGGW